MNLLEQCHNVEHKLVQLLESASLSQLQFKKNTDSWNSLEVVEHINLVEHFRTNLLQQAIIENKSTALAEQENKDLHTLFQETQERNLQIIAPEFLVPKGIYSSKATCIEALQNNRIALHDLVANNHIDTLRSLVLFHNRLGNMNIEEWVVYLNGHALRHAFQIEELLSLSKA